MNRAAVLKRLGGHTPALSLSRTLAALLGVRPGQCSASVYRGHDGSRTVYASCDRPLGGIGTDRVHAAVAHVGGLTRAGRSTIVAPDTALDIAPASALP